jgi:SAM-dependent MidA family methyltransferase
LQLPWDNDRVTFAQFMEHCLYDPEQGYYRSGRKVFGPEGDYYTVAHTHPAFSRLLADAFISRIQAMKLPAPVHFVELGAGEGILGRQILKSLEDKHPEMRRSVEYVPLEAGRGELPAEITGIVFCNEFFDALPVHRVRIRNRKLKEVYVGIEAGRITEVEDELSDSRISEYMETGFRKWREGWEYEVNLAMTEWLEELNRRTVRGTLFTFDYGFTWREYDSVLRPEGTLMSYRRHQALSDPYLNLGEQDITAHVNFEVMISLGRRFGWSGEALKTQREFLMEWGLERLLLEEEQQGILNPSRLDERLSLRRLVEPGGISDTMRCLVQRIRW